MPNRIKYFTKSGTAGQSSARNTHAAPKIKTLASTVSKYFPMLASVNLRRFTDTSRQGGAPAPPGVRQLPQTGPP
ncbi:MAG: hypothetical protein NC311_19165, partial [Muribaculaceae bacterium]|nr:hypothetical protein [Muribaculaceae bacterium]